MILSLLLLSSTRAEILVDSLKSLNEVLQNNDQRIKLKKGNYDIKDLPEKERVISFSGSNNEVDLSGVFVNATVGDVRGVLKNSTK